MFLQEYFLRESLLEKGYSLNYKINHKKGTSYHEDLGLLPIIFPEKIINFVEKLDKSKTEETYFKGVINKKRSWVKKYSNVFESRRGRDSKQKYKIDLYYYKGLCKSKYGLAPVNECPWSYRFFESIMCKAIPVLGKEEIDIHSNDYFYLRDGGTFIYNEEKANENYLLFLNKNTLLYK